MIQRVQTLYMTGAIVAFIAMFFFPLAHFNNYDHGLYVLSALGVKYMIEPPIFVNFWLTFPMCMMVIISLLLTGTAIFLYRKRSFQIWLVNISFLLNVILILLIFLYYTNHFEGIAHSKANYQFGIAFPLVSLFCQILASRAIRKDEALVKSSDRLR